MMPSDYGCLQTRFELRRAWDLSSNLSLGGNYIGLILSHSSVPSSRRNQYGLLKNRALLGRCSERDGVPARRWLSFECTAERGRREPCDCFDPSSTHQKASNTRPPLQFCGFTLVCLEPWRVSPVLAMYVCLYYLIVSKSRSLYLSCIFIQILSRVCTTCAS